MVKEIQLRVSPKIAGEGLLLKKEVSIKENISENSISGIKIIKKSIDARQRQVMINTKVRVWIDEPMSDELKGVYIPIDYKKLPDITPSAVVVGAGPAGLFAALRLIELGVRPILVERGKNVRDRRIDIAKISREGIVNPESNYCFGEGGAGAYSDGKLYTRSKKRGSVGKILSIFYQHGASESILVEAHPHIGTDKLPIVIENMRNTILRCGGEVHFETRVDKLIVKDNTVKGVITNSGASFTGPVILATGHSARDVYRFLENQNIELEEKGIAIGVRLEHPQHLIDCLQYHSKNGRGKYLPAAEYSFVTQIKGRGVYSFCMCPGGFIVPAASAPGQLVVNGMSPSNRGTKWANSGMVVEVRPEDIVDKYNAGVLKLMMFQEELEHECFKQANSSQKAGAQRMIDFVTGKESKTLPNTSYAPGIITSRLDKWLPEFISNRLKEGFKVFDKLCKGFLNNDAIVIGVETRTSSPVRIPRDPKLLSHVKIKGLYPCGEGAGYAGGIVSAAIDGENCAKALVDTLFEC